MLAGIIARLRSYWRAFQKPDRLAAEMDDEMRFHLEMDAERRTREHGLDPRAARRQAAIAFGGVERYKEVGRGVRGLTWVNGLSLDVRLAWRMLRKSPGLTVIGVLGIALGTAVHVAFFVMLSAHFFPKLPLNEGERLVALENWDVEANRPALRSLHDFVRWREEMRSVDPIGAAVLRGRALVTGDAVPEIARAAEMTAAGFQIARVPPPPRALPAAGGRRRERPTGGGDRPRPLATALRGRSGRHRPQNPGGRIGARRRRRDASRLRVPRESAPLDRRACEPHP